MRNKKKGKVGTGIADNKLITIFKVIIIVLTFTFYYNAIFNHFSMDDYHVNTDNPVIAKGIAGIPEIFTSLYAEESGMAYGYRPLVRTSFAIEYQFTSGLEINPYISHFINILLYIISVLLLYKVLRRLFMNYNIWFPFLVSVLFLAHPTHTEVVASLKNRDIILNFLFTFLAIWQFLKWVDLKRTKYLVFGLISYVCALLSKETAIAQLAVFPLVLYFFTDIQWKKLGTFISISAGLVIIVLIARSQLLPDTVRTMKMWENPLVYTDNFFLHISTGIYIIGFYLKMLFVPFPLLYYYGYNMIPVASWANPWVLITLLIIVVLLVIAVKKLKEKSIISFIILYFFINISMYANIVAPVPGIVADRFLFFAVISFAILIVWLLFTIFKIPLKNKDITKKSKLLIVSFLVIIIVIPYGYYTRVRNSQWRTHYSLYSADMPRLENSVKANTLYAHELMKRANRELAKPVNPYKFIIGIIDKAEKHYMQALKLDSTHFSSWNNLGIIYSKIHGNQAKLRVGSHIKYNKPEKAEMERKNAEKYFNTSIKYFRKAIQLNPEFGSAYFNLGNAYELQNNYDSAVIYFKKAVEVDGGEIVSMSRLANSYFLNQQPLKAIEINEEIIQVYPDSDMPYINLGNYAIKANDTLNAVKFFKKAVERGTNPEVGKLLSSYYSSIGDKSSADYYLRKSYEAEKLSKNKKEQ